MCFEKFKMSLKILLYEKTTKCLFISLLDYSSKVVFPLFFLNFELAIEYELAIIFKRKSLCISFNYSEFSLCFIIYYLKLVINLKE